jgi:hypothetical protein
MLIQGPGTLWSPQLKKVVARGTLETDNKDIIELAKSAGWEISGEVQEIPQPEPAKESKDELIAQAVELGLGAPSVLKRWSIDKLSSEIERALDE